MSGSVTWWRRLASRLRNAVDPAPDEGGGKGMGLAARAARILSGASLLVRVLALVILGLVIVSAGFVMLSAQTIRESTGRTLQERLLIAQVTAGNLHDRLIQVATVAALEAERLPTWGGPYTEETRSAWRALRLQFGSAVERIVAIDGQRRIIWSTPYDGGLLGQDVSDIPPVPEALNSREIIIDDSDSAGVPTALRGISPGPTVSVFSPLKSAGGGMVLIVVDLNRPGIADILRHVALGQTGYAEVVARDGTVLASPDPQRLGVKNDRGGHIATLIQRGAAHVGTLDSWLDGATSEDVVAFAPLSEAPLGVVVRQSSHEAFAFGETLFERALRFGAIVFVLALGVTWLLVLRLVQPVKVLTGACRRIAEGDLSRPISPMGGGEIALLADSFETMRGNLRASYQEIRRWGQELERMVLERTAELEEARDNLKASRDFLMAIFNSLEDQLVVIDRNHRVVDVNPALWRRYEEGRSPVGEMCYRAFHGANLPCELRGYGCPAEQVWRTGQPARAMHLHQDGAGRTVYVDILASPIRDARGRVVKVLEVARDLTESKRLEEQAFRTGKELSTLVSLSSAIACSMDLEAMLKVALDQVLALMEAPAGGIVVDGVEGEMEPVTVALGLEVEAARRLASRGFRPKDRVESRRVEWTDSQILCVPIAAGESVLGEMFVLCPDGACFGGGGRQLLLSIGSQLAVAIENARLYEAVRRKEEAMSSFMRSYIAAQEEERKRIARELHDDTAQSLTALAIAVEAALQAPTDSAAEVKARLEPARPLAERVSSEIDRIIRDLRPSLLDDLGLTEALGWYVDRRLRPLGIQVAYEVTSTEHRLTPELETALFRVAQEAMSNVARHARAENVIVALEFGHNYVQLDVEDDGCGFEVPSNLGGGRDGSHFGLLGMRERVHLLGGTLSIESRPGQGTGVRVRVPLQNGQRPRVAGGPNGNEDQGDVGGRSRHGARRVEGDPVSLSGHSCGG